MAGSDSVASGRGAPRSWGAVLAEHAARLGARPALTLLGRDPEPVGRWSYAELDSRARRLAVSLAERCGPDALVLLALPEGPEAWAALLGCLVAGRAVLPVDSSTGGRAASRLNSAAARAHVVLTTSVHRSRLEPLVERADRRTPLVWLELEELEAQGQGSEPNAQPVDASSPALWLAGDPAQSPVLRQGEVLERQAAFGRELALDERSVFVTWLPLAHPLGLFGSVLPALFTGAETVLLPAEAVLVEPARWLRALARHGGTVSAGTAAAFDLCVRRVSPTVREELDLSAWRIALYAAEANAAENEGLERFAEVFGPSGLQPSAPRRCAVRAGRVEGLGEPTRPAASAVSAAPAPVDGESAASPRREGPASYGQRSLYFVQGLAPEAAAYHISAAFEVVGGIEPAAFRASWRRLVLRHPALRTRFEERGGELFQVVADDPSFELRELALAEADVPGLRERLAELAFAPFELACGPLLRVILATAPSGRAFVACAVHHAVSDFWSLAVVLDELARLYRAERSGVPEPLLAAEADALELAVREARRLASPAAARSWAYWTARLGEDVTPLDLPADRPRPPRPSFTGAVVRARLPRPLAERCRGLARERGVTLYTLLLAAFEAWVARLCDRGRFTLGTPTAGRDDADFARAVGYFVNPVVLAARLHPRQSFLELIESVRREAVDAFSHADLPLPLLAERLLRQRDPARSPFFDVLFSFHGAPPRGLADLGPLAFAVEDAGVELEGLELRPLALPQRWSQFDLSFTAGEVGGELHLALAYARDLFDAATVERWAAGWITLLEAAVARPESLLASLPLLRPEERERLRLEWSAGPALVRPATALPTLPERFARQAAATPEAVASSAGDEHLSYAAVAAIAADLARCLRAHGCRGEECVGLRIERRADLPALVLGVLAAEAAYLPIDPAYPAERQLRMLADGRARFLVTTPGARLDGDAEARLCSGRTVIEVDREVPEQPVPWAGAAPHAESLAYVLTTSGSTGTPKGVAVRHGGLAALFAWAERSYSRDELRVVLAATSICFDISVFELFAPLVRGGRIVVAGSLLDLPSLAAAEALTLINTVPSPLAEVLRGADLPPGLRVLNLAGEALPGVLAERVLSSPSAGRLRLLNLYGPSEDTVFSTFARIPRGDARPPIGRPLDGTRAYVVDSLGELVPLGVPGELLLAGAGLARGYFGRPAATAERFVPDAWSGEPGARAYRTGDRVRWQEAAGSAPVLEFLGRLDHQVKLRGFRIELGEVEHALLTTPGVAEAVALVAGEGEASRLTAFVVAAAGAEVSARGVRRQLRERLPAFLVPDLVMVLDALPRTPSGKLDRRALAARAIASTMQVDALASASGSAVESPVARELAALWSELLGGAAAVPSQSFFELGGHSLLAMRLLSRVRERLGVEVPLAAFLAAPTLAALDALVAEAPRARARTVEMPPPGAGEGTDELPVTPAQARLLFLDRLAVERAVYHLPAVLRGEGVLDPRRLAVELRGLVDRHEALRAELFETARGWRQQVRPRVLVRLPVVDLSALPTERREHCARVLAREEGRRGFRLDAAPLLRARVLRLGAKVGRGEFWILLTAHHAVADGWSLGVLWGELSRALGAPVAETAPNDAPAEEAMSYREHVRRSAQPADADAAVRLETWARHLAGVPPLDLPADHPRPALTSFRGRTARARLDRVAVAALERTAREHRATPFMAALAVFEAVLARAAGQAGFAVGVPVAGRDDRRLEALVGLLTNTLVLRANVDPRASFAAHLAAVRDEVLAAYEHRHVPFEALVEAARVERDPSRNPLFQAMLAFQPGLPRVSGEALSVTPVKLDYGVARFDLTLFVEEGEDGWELALEAAAALFDATTAERLVRELTAALVQAGSTPNASLAELSPLPESARQQLALEWSGQGELPESAPLDVWTRFAAVVADVPDAVALVGGDETWSYRGLEGRALAGAAALRGLGIGTESLVGLCVHRRPELVAAMLATWAAGAGYVPLDPAYPRERLRLMVEDSAAALVLVNDGVAELVSGHGAAVRGLGEICAAGESPSLSVHAEPRATAYVIYTSGSTGRPKGVAIERGALATFLAWATRAFSAEDFSGVLASTSICFDLSIFELFGPLVCGGTVLLADDALALAPGSAAAAALAGRVRLLNTVPSAAAALLGFEEAGFVPPPTMNLAGEPLPRRLSDALSSAGAATVWNLYGPTEATTYATGTRVRPGEPGAPTIGRPLAGTLARVLDARGEPLPVGLTGELFLGGDALARGYLGRPALTAERFVPDAGGAVGTRLYRTGDLARWRADGELEFLGRADHQVKVRGFRVEPGEIEAALCAHPLVRDAAVVATSDLADRRLLAFVIASGDVPREELLAFLAARLPAHLVPDVLLRLEELPRTPNGKVDRRALTARGVESLPARERRIRAPRTPLEATLAALWAEELGLAEVGVDEDFFALGGQSLVATRLLHRVAREHGVELPLREFLLQPTVARMALATARSAPATMPSTPAAAASAADAEAREARVPYELSFAQQRFWLLHRLEPASPVYHLGLALRLRGRLDAQAFDRAFRATLARHDALATRFVEIDAAPRAVAAAPPERPLPWVDLRRLDTEARSALARRLAERAVERAIDLARGPVWRALMVRLGDGESVFALAVHHIAADAWSLEVLQGDLAAYYRGAEPAPVGLTYADYARDQRERLRGPHLDRLLAAWRERLAGAPEELPLPFDRPRSAPSPGDGPAHRAESHRGGELAVPFAAGLDAGVAALARREGATPFAVLLALWQALLARWTGTWDVVVGVPVANRDRAETSALVGLLVNTLALRLRLKGQESAALAARHAAAATRSALALQELPFDLLVEHLQPERVPGRTPIFQVLFSLLTVEARRWTLPGLETEAGLDLEKLTLERRWAMFDLSLVVLSGAGELEATLEYDAGHFDRTTVARLARAFAACVAAAAERPETSLAALPLLAEAERHQLAVEWSTTAPSAPALERMGAPHADAVAMVQAATEPRLDPGQLPEHWSRDEIEARAAGVASALRARGLGIESRVGLLAERSPGAAWALLGALRAGVAVVPLEVEAPLDRLRSLSRDSGVALLLAARASAQRAAELGLPVVVLEEIEAAESSAPDAVPDQALAYVLYTSGSTGRAKGVAVPRRALALHTRAAISAYALGPGDRVLQFAALHFDVALEEILPAWWSGATVVFRPPGLFPSFSELERLLAETGVTVANLPTHYWHAWTAELAAARRHAPVSLRLLAVGTEAARGERLDQWLAAGGARWVNAYGPTETTITATAFATRSTLPDGVTPIGRPWVGVCARVVDARLEPLPAGAVGELVIGGAGVARGYLGRPAETARRFVPDPYAASRGEPGARIYRTGDRARFRADGTLVFAGRGDFQVKVRGFRVELEEIEALALEVPGVAACAVVPLRGSEAALDELVGVWEATPGAARPNALEIASRLRARLPAHAVPQRWLRFDALPRTAAGKVDRRAVAAALESDALAGTAHAETPAEALSPLEALLASTWESVLGRRPRSPREDFFVLGGHSLAAAQVVARLREALGVELALAEFFAAPTLGALARAIEAARGVAGAGEPGPVRRQRPENDAPLAPAQARLWFLQRFAPSSAAYTMPAALGLSGRLDVAALGAALSGVVARHSALRTVFPEIDGRPVQRVLPARRLTLPVVDLTSLPAAGRRAFATTLGSRLAARPFDLAGPVTHAGAPLLAAVLLRESLAEDGSGEHTLCLAVHHIVFDGWSFAILVRELSELYQAVLEVRPAQFGPIGLELADVAVWQLERARGEVWRTRLAASARRFQPPPPPLELPLDRPRPAVQTFHGAVVPLFWPAALTDRLEALASERRATPFIVLLAGFAAVLARWSGGRDLVVGAPVSVRDRRELEGLIGPFLNLLAVRVELGRAGASFADLLERVRARTVAAFDDRDLPFETLVETLDHARDLSRNPLFQVMLAWQSTPRARLELPGLVLSGREVRSGAARFELSASLEPSDDASGGWMGEIELNADLFDRATVARLARSWRVLLAAAAAQPERAVESLDLLAPEERHQLLVELNPAARGALGESRIDSRIDQRIARRAAHQPEAIAVSSGDEAVSYGTLVRRAHALAGWLGAHGVGAEDRVGLVLARTVRLPEAMLGVLAAGAAYVPLDPAQPDERLRALVEEAGVATVLTDAEPESPPAPLGARLGGMARVLALPAPREEAWPVLAEHSSDQLAYVLFTSGSTGRPKGVMVPHQTVTGFFAAMDEVFAGPRRRLLATTGIGFDISVLELLWTLARGDRVSLFASDPLRAPTAMPLAAGRSRASADPEAGPGAHSETRSESRARHGRLDFSLFFFAASGEDGAVGAYELLLAAARRADALGFAAVWTPERHFHAFGGPYPNPAVTGAAVAAVTERVEIRAGSVVLPLHDPVRVAEEWAMVDALSHGRASVSFASGWHADDFTLAPTAYADRQARMYESIETVRALWRGEPLRRANGVGEEIELRSFPRPVQRELPVWVTAAGSTATFESAGRVGAGVLTHLLGQDLQQLGEKIAAYRRAWNEAGHAGEGRVALMLHTFIAEDETTARRLAAGPLREYLRTSVHLLRPLAHEAPGSESAALAGDAVERLLDAAVERYLATASLIGSPESRADFARELAALGVDDVACLIDFGVETEHALAGLDALARLASLARGADLPHAVREISSVERAGGETRAHEPREETLAAAVVRESADFLQCTPSTARLLLAASERERGALSRLEALLLGGEALPPGVAAELYARGARRLQNLYGPTETTIWSATTEISSRVAETRAEAGLPLPIGRPIAGTALYVVDGALTPVPMGVDGELLIAGAGVARGYLGRPRFTAERFLPDPWSGTPGARLYRTGDRVRVGADGALLFLGRVDHQVKLRGHRIELGEIESALVGHERVAEAVVVLAGEGAQARLVAYVRPRDGRPAAVPGEGERDEAFAGLARFRLPNGLEVAHLADLHTSVGYREIFEDEIYFRHGIDLPDGACVFDVGANMGLFSLQAATRCPRLRLFAFEPIPPTHAALAANLRLYGPRFGTEARVFNVGVGSEASRARFTFYPLMDGLSGRYADPTVDREITRAVLAQQIERGDGHLALSAADLEAVLDQQFTSEVYDCEIRPLSAIIDEHEIEHIDLLKVDVERAEVEVLAGIRDEHWARIDQVVLEIDGADHRDEIEALLRARGFDVVVDDFVVAPAVGAGPPVEVYMLYARRPGLRRETGTTASPAALEPLSPASLSAYLADRLPAVMVPAAYVFLDAMPLTANGKVDRKALPTPEAASVAARSASAFVAPRNELERRVAEVWRRALGVERVGVNDNFFEIGGNSLLLAEVHTRLREATGHELSLLDVFRHSTVAALAEHLAGLGTLPAAPTSPSLPSAPAPAEAASSAPARAVRGTAATALERQRQFLEARRGGRGAGSASRREERP